MIEIVTADITTLATDAIVNAANGALRGGGGVDGAIHRAAGPQLMTELKLFPGCPTGEAVRTRGYKLRARYVIHAVGPVWHGGAQSEAALLARAYESAFARAQEAGDIKSIAFPALSTGAYRFPKPDAAASRCARCSRTKPSTSASSPACTRKRTRTCIATRSSCCESRADRLDPTQP